MFTAIKNFVYKAINTVLALLPNSPFRSFIRTMEDNDILNAINWILPIADFIAILEVWLTAIAVFYVYMVILRWAKAVE